MANSALIVVILFLFGFIMFLLLRENRKDIWITLLRSEVAKYQFLTKKIHDQIETANEAHRHMLKEACRRALEETEIIADNVENVFGDLE
jgi:hypothetical protein